MRANWMSLCTLFFEFCIVMATDTEVRCMCSGRSGWCLRDELGLRCIDCEGNSEGRRCERCKDGFYQQGASQSCIPCGCHAAGSVGTMCDHRGQCTCREGITGEKCDRCSNGPIGHNGCLPRRRPREDSGAPLCFCYGHSNQCSPQAAYTVHNITSTFAHGPEGWRVATSHNLTPADVHYRWSPKHQDVEVISRNSLPVFLYAPASYLGNRLLSYGQNLSFSLRLDRGIPHPSINDVILEGSGLRVSASLGDLRSEVPCGQKINYTFRLDEKPGSRWRPQLSRLQFQTLLQNLSAIKIRATFGNRGRGYLDNVKLVSARRGEGTLAGWVQVCVCPQGYDGDFCEQCSAGFKRRKAMDGAFSPCEPCSCRGGDCDPHTGDCYPADETQSCSDGFYWDFWTRACIKCPCPDGALCSLVAGSAQPQCHFCPPGTTGVHCDECQEGFYGAPAGSAGERRGCRPCECNGHIDVRVAGSCERTSGECLKCVNNTMGRQCDVCLPGFYHRRVADACRSCNCDLRGSESAQCDNDGRCRCKPGFEGSKCQTSRECPICFNSARAKVEEFAIKLQQLEALNSQMGSGFKPTNNANILAVLSAAEALVKDLEGDAKRLTDMDKRVQENLSSIGRAQLSEEQDVQNMADATGDIKQRQQTYVAKVAQLRNLMDDMKGKLDQAKADLRSFEVAVGDASLGPNVWTALAKTASSLADKHQTKAGAVDRSASEALSDAQKGLALVRTLVNKENKVKELIGDVKNAYDNMAAQTKSLENLAAHVSHEATDERNLADGMVEDIARMERDIPSDLKEGTDTMAAKLDFLREAVDGNTADFEVFQDDVHRDKVATQDLLAQGRSAQQDVDTLINRVNAAKADTEGALQRISSNTDKLDAALNTLRGFDQQIATNKALVDSAIKRFPVIDATIQKADKNNAETLALLEGVSEDSNGVMESINLLENLIPGLEGTLGPLLPHSLINNATKLHEGAKELHTQAGDFTTDLKGRLHHTRRQVAEADEAAFGADTAWMNAKRARDAAGRTLQDINNMLANINQPGTLDLQRLQQLEDSLAIFHNNVETHLRPELREVEVQEAARRRQLNAISRDIDAILADITNLEDILKAIPNGCYNGSLRELQ
ncbi:laminin subunit gamma-2 [Dunckerocampus dactyliophorus]|uniref:laminin subunit gamma-2 n=1 Tax=Dunckerocampus dactyliophorus TaxID=161453 RepID=UPI0024054634|nr:laminin subunit gamma-2 [Dunckerocampus dactyliophorus]